MRYIEWFCKETIKNGCDSIIFLGDWFENRNSINILTFNNSLSALRKLNSLNIPIFFIIGNHDLYYRNNRDIHSLDFLMEFSNIIIIDTPTILDDNKLLCPFLFKEEYPEITPLVNKSEYVFGHWEFRNFYLTGSSNQLCEHGFFHKLFESPKFIFSGHYHKRQASENVIYIGNPFGTNWGDINDPNKGMATIDFSKDLVDFIDWSEGPIYIKCSLTSLLNGDIIPREGSRVKCIQDIDITYSEVQQMKQELISSFKLRELILEENSKERQELLSKQLMEELDEMDLSTINETIMKMLSTEIDGAGIDGNLLVQIYGEL